MNRPFYIFSTGVLALLLLLGGLFQSGADIASAEESTTDPGRVHHFEHQTDSWDPRLSGIEDDRGLQLVVGTDERKRVSPTNVIPYQSIAYMEAWDDEQEMGFSCTATFIGPNTLLTAAHCIWVDEFEGWPDRVIVAPGKDGEANPFGYELASSLWVPSGWSDTTGNTAQRFQWDFGLITLASNSLGDTVGAMEVGVLTDATLQQADFNPTTSGYPGDMERGTQWTSTQPAFDRVNATFLVNSIDAFQGQSGSAIWGADDGRIAGIVSFETRTTNYALRMSERVLDGLHAGCSALNCEFNYSIEGDEPEPTPPAEPTPGLDPVPSPTTPPEETPPAEPTPSQPGTPAGVDAEQFFRTWERTDRPVADGAVNRTWMWGPDDGAVSLLEPYLESPGGQRAVTYFDKSRMELTNPQGDPASIWHITNGLLVLEMITGNLQVGVDSFEQHQPAAINVAGDPDDPNSPTYASFAGLLDAPAQPEGQPVTQWIGRDGSVLDDPALVARGVTATRHVPETGHTVASVFWEFMNIQGLVYENDSLTIGPLFQNPFYATGLPVSEAYWTTVRVAGIEQEVLIQAFERRALTFTPANTPGWEVEAGNVGRHYYQWRYGEIPSQ